ncbi:MAG: single-stranded-DNA-specific exonuclease RecJ [Crocinitomicaceae bacterium]|nr:single-stranded-DNA-specific exonuclease RecJ [Crocinitomicaceae bacterium]MDG1775855.1 single-stranded-DNA-specific exonuclease RecJ [Crocinitomicaceae bacterium]
MQKKWQVKTPIARQTVDEFRSELKVTPLVAELLLQRNIQNFPEAEGFFRPKLEQLHDPFLMQDMEQAVDRLQEAIDEGQKVLLFGDYDVDGTTAVALMYTFLKDTLPIDFYIPDRYKEGYGLSILGIDFAKKHGVDLIISLDCGIKSLDEIAHARSLGIDFIVCDHHTPGEKLPDALVLDPKRIDCNYPFDELSGCGVGFKLLQGLCDHNGWSYNKLFELLDFLAISIGADIVPVVGENRVLCFHGMELLNKNPRVAFKELLKLANKQFPVTLTDVIFSIAPRINAAGRLRSGRHAVELMVSNDTEEINDLATEINNDNLERRQLDAEITAEALEILENEEHSKHAVTNVVFKDSWHKGVVGIVASRIIEKHYKPTIVLTESNGLVTGSARSIKDFNVYNAISECSDLLEQFGGHKFAAGLTMKPENIEAFKVKFEEVSAKTITKEMLIEEQDVDLELGFNEIFKPDENRMKIPQLKRILRQFEPHGPGNMKPVFLSKNVYSTAVRTLKDVHLKLSMTQPTSDVVIEGIGFNLGDKLDLVASGMPFDIVYTLEINKWKDRETLQLNIKDIRGTL